MTLWVLLVSLSSALADDPEGGASTVPPLEPAAEALPVNEPAAEQLAEPAAEDPALVASEEILVWGERVGHARGQLELSLRDYGYHLRRTRDGTAVYGRTGRDRWKPKVLIREDGIVMFRDPRVVVAPPVGRVEPSITSETAPGFVNAPSGQPDRGSVSVGFPIMFPSKKLQGQEKGRVMEAIGGDIRAYKAALAGEGEAQLLSDLPNRLDRLWAEGAGWEGTVYPDIDSRRAALLDLYASRADTRAGQAAKRMIEDFVVEVVQSSETPLTEAERARALALGLTLD